MSSRRLPPMNHLLLVALGGAVGAVARVAVAAAFPAREGEVPWVTLAENLGGAFLLALLLTVIGPHVTRDPTIRLLVGTGALGAFTTYSAHSVELVRLVDTGAGGVAAIYLVLTLTGGLTAAGAGVRAGSCLAGRRATRLGGHPEPDRSGDGDTST